MKAKKSDFIIPIGIAIIIYIVSAFGHWELNPEKWEESMRALLAFIWIVFSAMAIGITKTDF